MRFSKLAARKAQLLLLEPHDPPPVAEADETDPRPEMLCFRGQTLALVRHFFELSCQVGRLPSLLGREFFRARVSHHSIPSFEEQAVFTRDVELCLARLSDDHAEIITLVGLYDFTLDEVAEMLRYSKTAVHRWFSEALDYLSEIFLRAGILSEQRPDRRQRQVTKRALPADVAAHGKKPPRSLKVAPKLRPAAPLDCSAISLASR
jgi:DNA-directed RNA polymerase specialized sigma24 family protein